MPVITTAANAMYTQGYLDVADQNACSYETIGAVRTLDAAATLGDDYSDLTSETLLTADCAVTLNSRDHYEFVTTATALSSKTIEITGVLSDITNINIRSQITANLALSDESAPYVDDFNGQF